MTDVAVSPAPGWFGKVPTLGDFASRRLPEAFIETWDEWLARSVQTSQQTLGDTWADIYLGSPIWRFALMPGVCGSAGWAGILAPSVDKIGRYFPLTIVTPVEAQAELPAGSPAAQTWYAKLEQVALTALDVTSGVDEMERALESLPYPCVAPAQAELAPSPDDALARWWLEAPGAPRTFAYAELNDIGPAIRNSPLAAARLMTAGRSLWWSAPPIAEPAIVHAFMGLPPDHYFAVLMQGGRALAPVLPATPAA